jgi:hypothetical protein
MAQVLQHNNVVERPSADPPSSRPDDDRLAPAIGVFNAVWICSLFWFAVALAVYLLA